MAKKRPEPKADFIAELDASELKLINQFIQSVQRLGQKKKFKKTGITDKLSPRETEVLKLLAADYSVIQSAEHLGIAPTTLETHRQSIKAKLNVRGVAGMTRIAIREGLIEP